MDDLLKGILENFILVNIVLNEDDCMESKENLKLKMFDTQKSQFFTLNSLMDVRQLPFKTKIQEESV